jgi:hypothetical protein
VRRKRTSPWSALQARIYHFSLVKIARRCWEKFESRPDRKGKRI